MAEGTLKSLSHISKGEPFNEVAYTMNQSAAALGKAQLTFKKWVADGLIPPPVYVDTSHGYTQYLCWEIEAMVDPIADHFDCFDYLLVTHDETVHAVWASVELVRRKRGRNHVRKKEA